MEQEILFARTLEEVKKTARKQGGFIEKEKVEEAFAQLQLSPEKMQMVLDYLVKSNIGIDTPIESNELLTEEEKTYLQNYYDDLERLPLYTDGEKRAYAIAAMAGETDARQNLVQVYLREVAEIAKLYTGQGVYIEDLIGEGNLALAFGCSMLESLESPDEVEGALMKMVMNAMEELIKTDEDSAKIGKRALDRVNQVNDKAKELSESYGRKVTVEELINDAGLNEKAVRDALRISGFKLENVE